MKQKTRNYPRKLEKLNRFLKRISIPFRVTFILMGVASTIWFLARVIPKPSRAVYPCMQAAAPVMSSFIIWLITITSTAIAIKKAKVWFARAKYLPVAAFIAAAILFSFLASTQNIKFSSAKPIAFQTEYETNDPYGTGQGIFPGRVVWTWDPDATNENQTRTDDGEPEITENDDYYFLEKNNDQDVIDELVASTIKNLTGEETLPAGWDALFKYHNEKKSGTANSYTQGEKIFIKINATSIGADGGAAWHTWKTDSIIRLKPNWWGQPDVVETSPQIVLSVLRQLVNEAGVQEEDIYVGDPIKNVYQQLFDMWKSEFPNINVLGNDRWYNETVEGRPLDLSVTGRIPVVPTAEDVMFWSDKGAVMDAAVSDKFYTIHEEADYLINIPSLKAHAAAGITLCAKNHFGSHSRTSAQHLHKGLVGVNNDEPYRTSYGMYRVQVDLMGHELLGGNTMLFLVDALYSGEEGWTEAQPIKWRMAPFNNDFTNSVIASLDPVALESVCFDLLRTEYDGTGGRNNRPNFGAVDDYLHQAADPALWADGVTYDPENDGVPMGSMGIHEHWNSPEKMQYSRNLGLGFGIELYAPGIVNNLPQSTTEPGVHVLHISSKPVIMFSNLTSMFTDPDEDELTFSVSTSNPDNLDAMMQGDTTVIVMTGESTGTEEVVIHVSDGSDTLDYPVLVNIIDETFMAAINTDKAITFDGLGNDTLWQDLNWYYIDQVWMPYRANLTANDFSGRYKVAWSDTENVIYFLAETTDDVFVDGYVYNIDPSSGGGYYNYDILEIFIDEDKSGGMHIFDDGSSNAENAFSYHIVIEEPEDDGTVTDLVVCDIAGTNWGYPAQWTPDYASHFEDFIVRRKGNTLTWEFSLKLYNDTYDDTSPEDSRATLSDGKQIGLSLAYCDNDDLDEDPPQRDNFIGSDVGPDGNPTEYNDHWMNADVYGTLKLIGDQLNQSPVVDGTIDDLVISENNMEYTVVEDLGTIFSDPDGDQLIFTIETDYSNLDVVIVTIGNVSKATVTALDGFSGAATVTVKASDGEFTLSTEFEVSSTVSTFAYLKLQESIQIMPNPVRNTLHMNMDNELIGLVNVTILDLSGREINRYQVNKTDRFIHFSTDFSYARPGIYMIRVQQGNTLITKKIIH